MPKHIKRLLGIMVMAGVAAIAAKYFFTADSFGVYGHYRANAVPEIAGQNPQFQGSAYCQQCHTERHTQWSAGKHQSISCEDCHGPAAEHPLSGKLAIPTDTVRLCSTCHEAMPARPALIKQVVIAEHMGSQACIECHNPHSPTHFTWEDTQELTDQLRQAGTGDE